MDEKVIEGNSAIAEFMGAEYQKDWSKGIYKKPMPNYKFTEPPTEHASYNWSPEGLSYHVDWKWLMPVVERIEGIENSDDYEIDIFGNCCDIGGKIEIVGKTKIEAVWLAVIEFIKWYSEKQKS